MTPYNYSHTFNLSHIRASVYNLPDAFKRKIKTINYIRFGSRQSLISSDLIIIETLFHIQSFVQCHVILTLKNFHVKDQVYRTTASKQNVLIKIYSKINEDSRY